MFSFRSVFLGERTQHVYSLIFAAIADEKLTEAGLLPEGVGRTLHDMQLDLLEIHDIAADHAAAIEAIEDEGFSPAQFISSRNTQVH